jgi:antitoxin VapB
VRVAEAAEAKRCCFQVSANSEQWTVDSGQWSVTTRRIGRDSYIDCALGEGNYLQEVMGKLIYTFDRYFLEGRMATSAGTSQKPTDAKLFWSGRSQAVRLPKAFRFEGDRVRVSRMGAGILLEPVPEVKKETVEEWFARMDAMGADPLFPEGRKQNLAPIHEYFK